MSFCKCCGDEHDADSLLCSECGMPITKKETVTPKKPVKRVEIVEGLRHDIVPDEETVKCIAAQNQRIFDAYEKQIGDTIYIVYNVVPKDCTDEQIKEQAKKKVERLILNAVEDEIRNNKTT